MARDDRVGWPVVLAAAVPGLVLRLMGTYLRFLSRRRRGTRAFRKTLYAGGMPRAQADRLVQAYAEAVSFRRIVRGVRSARGSRP